MRLNSRMLRIIAAAAIFISLCEGLDVPLALFRDYGYIGFSGKYYYSADADSKMKCALQCMSNKTCPGFVFNTSCYIMDGLGSVGLTFDNGANIMWKRKELWDIKDFPPGTSFQNNFLTRKLSVGDLIYFKGFLLYHDDVRIQIQAATGELMHFRARCGDNVCDSKLVVATSLYYGGWSPTGFESYGVYNLQANQEFTIHMLISADGFMVYLNRVLITTHRPYESYEAARNIYFGGPVKIQEFST